MTKLSPALDNALAGIAPTIFGALEIALPDHTIRVLDCAGIVAFDTGSGSQTFTGQDATYGVLHSAEDLTDGTGDEAPSYRFTFAPASDAASASLASASMQGSRVRVWVGAVEPSNGLVIGTDLRFDGNLDVPTILKGTGSRLVQYDCVSEFEQFFMDDDGARLSDTFHRYVWPGEMGMAFMTGVAQQLYWGQDAPSGVKR